MTAALAAWWAEAASSSKDGRVLYIGVGDGHHAVPLARHAGELVGVEDDARRLERFQEAAERAGCDNVRAVEALPHALELRDEYGLVVVAASLTNGVADPAIRGGIVKRAAAHCRGDGSVVLRLLNPHWLAAGMPVSATSGDLRLEVLDEDAWEQRYRARLTRVGADGDETTEVIDATALYPREVRALAYQSGLEVVATWGDQPGESMLGVGGAAWHVLCEPAV